MSKWIPDRVRAVVATRYGAVPGVEIYVPCHYCGSPGRIYWYTPAERMGLNRIIFGHQLDHVIPRSLGGPTVPENLVLACRPCNLSKGTKALPGQWAIDGLAWNVTGSPPALWRTPVGAHRAATELALASIEPPTGRHIVHRGTAIAQPTAGI